MTSKQMYSAPTAVWGIPVLFHQRYWHELFKQPAKEKLLQNL